MSTNALPDLRVEAFSGSRRMATIESLISTDPGVWGPDTSDPPPVCGSDGGGGSSACDCAGPGGHE